MQLSFVLPPTARRRDPLAKADKALYKVKNSGKSNYQIELSD
jgi:PleD family two-component response regulator